MACNYGQNVTFAALNVCLCDCVKMPVWRIENDIVLLDMERIVMFVGGSSDPNNGVTANISVSSCVVLCEMGSGDFGQKLIEN